MNNIQIANETVKICNKGSYSIEGELVELPSADYSHVDVWNPAQGKELLSLDLDKLGAEDAEYSGNLTVVNKDSFEAARDYTDTVVLNFANAHNPGGGFMLGANAQEECLCRNSTLYKSLISTEAKELYNFNNSHISKCESDFMLFTPYVYVFRDKESNLIKDGFTTSVLTAPAPNRHGTAMLASAKNIEQTFKKRIRIILRIAIRQGKRNIVLGAWGCGAFGNKPYDVAEYFRGILIDEGYLKKFDNVVFAIYGKDDSANIKAFKKVLFKQKAV